MTSQFKQLIDDHVNALIMLQDKLTNQERIELIDKPLNDSYATFKPNCLIVIAKEHDRNIVTPEDVSDALRLYTPDRVRFDFLEVLSARGCEDYKLCAHIAFRGTPEME